MPYERIQNLCEVDGELASPELESLGKVWRERKQSIAARGSLDAFVRRLMREWAIETGIIERLYQWDRGVTEVLIEQGIDAALIVHGAGISHAEAHQISDLIKDQEGIIEGLFEFVKGQQSLTEHYIRSLHSEFTRHQDTVVARTPEGQPIVVELRKGAYKRLPNNPRRRDGSMHEYCPPEIVRDEMQNLLAWFDEAQAAATPPEVLAAWLHHRFTQIHPFQDGNGRVARALATLVFLQHELFPLVLRDRDRDMYLDALAAADQGDLAPLVALFVRRQREAIFQAMSLEREVQREEHIEEILDAAVTTLKRRREAHVEALGRVFERAEQLEEHAYEALSGLTGRISGQIEPLSTDPEQPYSAKLRWCRSDDERSRYYFKQIVEIAQQFDYFANTNDYRAWIRLVIQTEEPFYFLISFHGLGREFEGVLAASAFVFRRSTDEDGTSQVVGLRPVMQQLFQFNYAERLPSTHERFDVWLKDAMTMALAEWQRSLAG